MIKFFKSRKPGPTDLTWDEKNASDYCYRPEKKMQSQKPKDKIVVIDFDGTLCKFAFPDVGPIEPDVKIALQLLKDAGYIIKIHSCRTASYWNRPNERITHVALIQQFMLENKLPYDELILTDNKPIADVYIDDRAIRYNNNWLEIAKELTCHI